MLVFLPPVIWFHDLVNLMTFADETPTSEPFTSPLDLIYSIRSSSVLNGLW
jgi:hypothetical protein